MRCQQRHKQHPRPRRRMRSPPLDRLHRSLVEVGDVRDQAATSRTAGPIRPCRPRSPARPGYAPAGTSAGMGPSPVGRLTAGTAKPYSCTLSSVAFGAKVSRVPDPGDVVTRVEEGTQEVGLVQSQQPFQTSVTGRVWVPARQKRGPAGGTTPDAARRCSERSCPMPPARRFSVYSRTVAEGAGGVGAQLVRNDNENVQSRGHSHASPTNAGDLTKPPSRQDADGEAAISSADVAFGRGQVGRVLTRSAEDADALGQDGAAGARVRRQRAHRPRQR